MEEQAESLFAEVRSKLKASDAAGAVNTIWPYVAEHPEDGSARSLYGLALCMAGSREQGISELRSGVTLLPEDPQVRFNLAVAQFQAGNRAEARAAAEETLQLDPAHEKAQAMLQHLASSPAGPAAPSPPSYQAGASRQPGMQKPIPGMAYQPAAVQPYSSGKRALLGLAWGAAYSQWWTLWNIVWMMVYNASSSKSGELIFMSLLYFAACTVVGSIAGSIVFAIRGNRSTGMIAGVAGGMLLMLGEYLITRSSTEFINVIFWYFTGRLVGRLIGIRSMRTP